MRQRRARAIADNRSALSVAWALTPLAALLVLWRTGRSARLRDLLRRRLRAPWLQRATYGAVLGALVVAVQAPFALGLHRIAAAVSLTDQPIGSWFLDQLLRLAIVALVSAVVIAVVLELVDRLRTWYLATTVLVTVVTLAVVAIEPALFAPLLTEVRPAPAAIVAQGDAIAHALGVAPVPIEIAGSSARSNALVARASGFGPFARVILGDATVGRLSPQEREFVLARLYAHQRGHDSLVLTLIGVALFVLAATIAVAVSDRIGFRRDDDPLSRLALVATFLGLAALALYPAFNAAERRIEARADSVALGATHDPASAVRYFVRRADDDLVVLCPRRSTRWYTDGRPPLATRIAAVRGTTDGCPP